MKVLILEDDQLMLNAIIGGLRGSESLEIEGSTTAADAMMKFRGFNPDACLVDIELKAGPTGVDVAHAMRRLNPDIGIVFLTSLADPRLVDSAIPDLPEGSIYLKKDAVGHLNELTLCLAVSCGQAPRTELEKLEHINSTFLDLSREQFEIIRLISAGHSNKEIAKIKSVTLKSAETAISRLAKKLEITESSTRNQRVLIARRYLELIGKL